MIESVEASRESETEEKGKDGQDLYRLWMDAIRLAEKEEEEWRKCADGTVKIYRNEKKNDDKTYSSGDRKFNILHANVETLLPALYNSTPVPDVRRRYDDKNPTGKQVADILERSLGYSIDSYDLDNRMRHAVSDMELTGRGVTRVRYMPYVGEDDEVSFEEAACEHVAWKHFRRGPGRVWDDVPWIAFELFLSRDELLKLAPEIGGKINLDATMAGADDKKNGENPPEIFKRAKVWEIWDKTQRKVIFFAESYKDGPIREEDDPLGLMEFFCVPRPLYAVETSDSLIPVVPFELYKDQAEELERVSQRIMALTEAMKARGVYDGRAEEISKLSDSDDNTLIAIENVATFADGSKLADKIHYWPIDVIVAALEKLYVAREQIKQTIYEITGIADILRGQTDANETLGAQELKAQWGSLRIQRKQNEIARYARDLFRIKAEIIATKFSWETIALMTGLNFPSQQDKQQAQMMAQQAQQMQQPLPPELEEILKKPSREEIEQMLRSDAIRGFNIDIESDSTIRADLTRKQQNMNLFLQGTAQYAAAMGPIVMAPQFQALAPAVIEVFSAFARNFKLGKQAEDALDAVADDAKQQMENPQPPPEDPALQVEKLKAQNEQEKMKAEFEFKQQEHGMKLEMMRADLEKKRMELEMQSEKMNLDMQAHQQKMAMDQESQERDAMMQERQAAMQMQQSEHEHALGMESSSEKHRMGLEALYAKMEAQEEALEDESEGEKDK
jgi:hypothetical protein